MTSHLFSPFTMRGQTFKNRVVISPMSQYRSKEGFANDWHMVLADPNWPLRAKASLEADAGYQHWPVEAGWWLERRDRLLSKPGLR